MKKNYPISIQVYLGSGEKGIKRLKIIDGLVGEDESRSEKIMELLEKAAPEAFQNGK